MADTKIEWEKRAHAGSAQPRDERRADAWPAAASEYPAVSGVAGQAIGMDLRIKADGCSSLADGKEDLAV